MRQSGVRVGPTSRDTGPHKRKRSRSQVTLEAEAGDTAAARSPQDCRQAQRLGGAGGTLPGDALTLDFTLPENEFLLF